MKQVTDQDDPRRCRASSTKGGQCMNVAVEDQKYCAGHGGQSPAKKDRADYLTEQFEKRIQVDADATDAVKLLQENLMSLNQMLAAYRLRMTDEASLKANVGPFLDTIMKAEKLTVSLNRLSIASGLLLAKPALVTWGQQIVQAITEMVEDKYDGWEDDLVTLSDTVAGIIVAAQNVEETK